MGSQADVQPLSGDMGESLGSKNLWEGRTMDYTELVNLQDNNVKHYTRPHIFIYTFILYIFMDVLMYLYYYSIQKAKIDHVFTLT